MIFTKVVRQQNMRDPRWSTKDKLTQYRGILRLYGREKTRKYREATTTKNKIACQLAGLRTDVQQYRGIIRHSAAHGVERHVYSVLQNRTDLRIRCRDRGLEDTCEAIQEENFFKRRTLDKLRYEKEKKIERCLALQLERVELANLHTKEGDGNVAADRTKQILVTRYQRSMARQNAAKAIRSTYVSILKILKSDAVNHESLLNQVKNDQKEQCTVILRATLIGQLATESADDIAMKYKRIARHVWKGMKERERSLTQMRDRLDDLWNYARSLIRTESSPDVRERKTQYDLQIHTNLDRQIQSLEEIFHSIRESLLANSYLELFSRLEDQAKQRARLFEQFERNTAERELCMNKRTAALSELSSLERALISTTQKYRTEVQGLQEQIDAQQKRETEHKTVWKTNGELILQIKAALRNMIALLITVRKSAKPRKGEKDEVSELEKRGIVEKTETEGLTMLSDVSRRVGMLFGMSNFELEPDKENKARDLYRTYVSVCRSRMAFSRAEAESTSFLVEHEIVDVSVPTRGQIKLHSKQLMEAHLKLD